MLVAGGGWWGEGAFYGDFDVAGGGAVGDVGNVGCDVYVDAKFKGDF